jgi:hypothetical protein
MQGTERLAKPSASAPDAEYRDSSCRGAAREAESFVCKIIRRASSAHGCLTPRSSGAPTAGHQARSGGTQYIFTGPGLVACRWRPLSSNVRPQSPTFAHSTQKGIMATFIQRLGALSITMSMVACTSLQQLPEGNSAGANRAHRQVQGVVIGDTLTIKSRRDAAFELVVTAVNTESITGTQDGRVRQISLSDIESIEQRRFDVLRTTLIFVGLGIIALGQYAKGVSKLSNP